ncbi:MAG: helix-turn-helix domain-containing protein [Holophagaceae bacterium]|nr:helix-turn-helix domain-containing protein [Holophagaceae bacterium]
MSERLWFKIGEAAESAGVTAREIRYWEKKIPEIRTRRSKGNQRHYHRDSLPKLRDIAGWVNNGYTVAECRELLVTGSITRDLGLYIDEPNIDSSLDNSSTNKKTKNVDNTGNSHVSATSPEETGESKQQSIDQLLLQKVISSVKQLLARLQNPVP